MCGIAGIIYRDPERPGAAVESLVRRMCAAIKHRGPDDEGLYVRRGVGLGMRRLSIIDLSGGRQPIFNEDASKVIVFNGEIYNYRDLRADLIRRGHQFGSSGDTETILHLYEERGADCTAALRGMFAFAIWDESAETLLLARDRFGIKPLYVLTAPWGIAFASELKALHAAELTTRTLDWEALDAFFQVGYIPAPASPFRDVRKLEPGHTLEWRRDGGVVTRRYWQFPLHERPSPPNAEARVREWLDASVAAHLVSDVPVAAFLSGGLDSSAVVASMALAGDAPPPHAFTARYTGSGSAMADETDLARALAERHRAERRGLYAPGLGRHMSGTAARARFRQVFASQGQVSGLAAGLYLDYSTFLPDDILALSDRLSMAHSLEVRVPFVDHELVESVFPLPQRMKIGPLWEKKRLLRRALRPRLPKQHLSAPKRGFVGPTAAWLRSELRPLLTDELSPDRQRRLGYFDPAAVQTVLHEHLTGRQNQEQILWALLCFSTWHRLYLE